MPNMLLHTGIELLFISAGTFALVTSVREVCKRMDQIIAALEMRSIPPLAPAYDPDGVPPASTDYVTCGGCGRTVELLDGFNPAPHDCDGIDNALLAK